MKRLTVVLGIALAAGCARAFPPPGGERDTRPPGLESVTPEPLSAVPASREPVVFRFDERISERRFNRTLVTVTPAAPEDVHAEVSGQELRISLDGGWEPDRVYQILVRPGITDLFGNQRQEGVELVFSTGDPPPPSALAGVLEERVTGAAPRDAVVEATRRGDSAVYLANADSAGFFALRNVPYGTYDVVAYADLNRNRRLDASEAMSAPQPTTLAAGRDTLMLALRLLPRDTTGPRLTEAERLDSLNVRLTFDDYIDPDSGLAGVGVQLLSLPDSNSLPHGARLLMPAVAERERTERAAADTTAAAARAAERLQEMPTVPVPERGIVLVFTRPLPPAEEVVRISGVRNVNGLPGGGTVSVPYRAPTVRPQPEPTPPPTPDNAPPARR